MLTDPLFDIQNTKIAAFRRRSLDSKKYLKTKVYKKPIFSVIRPEQTYISIDQAIQYTGDNSRYSKRILSLLSFIWLSYGFLIMGISLFIGPKATVFCYDARAGGFRECEAPEYCAPNTKIIMSPNMTIVSDFKLICHKEYYIPWISSIIYISNTFSSAFFPYFIDKHGRRETLVLALFLAAVAITASAMTWDFRLWMLSIFIAGFFYGGVETTARVYLSEISGQNFRVNSTVVLSLVWAISQILLGFLHMLVEYWRYIFIAFMAVPTLLGCLVGYFLLDESPRYLISKGCLNEAKQVLHKITKINRRPPFQFSLVDELSSKNITYDSRKSTRGAAQLPLYAGVSYSDIWGYVRPRIPIFLIWAVYYFAYFGLQFSMNDFKDAKVSFTFNGVAELLGVYISSQILKRYPKVPLLKWQLFIASAACLCFRLASSDSYLWSFLIFR